MIEAKPSPRIVVVDVRPTNMPSSEENAVDDAYPKIDRASAEIFPLASIEKSDDPAALIMLKRLAD